MTTADIVSNSIACRLWQSFGSAALKYAAGSSILKKISTPSHLNSAETVKSSVIAGWALTLANIALRPLTAAGNTLRRPASGSFFLNLTARAEASESAIIRTAAGVKVETALWLVIFYPIIDYLMRNIPALEFLAGGWDELLLLFILLAWPVQMAVRGKPACRFTGLEIPLTIYAGIAMFLFFMRSPSTSLALEGVRVYLEYLAWFFVGSNLLLNRRQFDALVKGMITVAVLVAAVGIYQYITGVQTPDSWVDKAEGNITRVFSIVVSPNVLGSLLLFFIPMTTAQILNCRTRRNRYIYLAALAAQLACLAFSGSRGAWLALGISAAAFCLMCHPRLLVMAAAGATAAIKLVPSIGERMGYLLSPAYMASSSRGGRLALWTMGINNFLHDPLLGSGFGTFGGAVAARRVPGSIYMDNFYLKTMVESGAMGLLALLWLMAEMFRQGYAAYRIISSQSLKVMAAAILSGLLGVALHNCVENIFEVPLMTTYFWFLAGILLSLPRIDGEKTRYCK